MPEPTERTYKHKVHADVFVEAFTTLEWTAEQKKRFNALGIERLTHKELTKKEGLNEFYFDEGKYTLLSEIEIVLPGGVFDIEIKDIKTMLPNIVVYKSKMPAITIKNCELATYATETKEIEAATQFHIIDSPTGYFRISSSTTGYFRISSSTTGYFRISSSTTGHFSIESSTTGYFRISSSTTGYFSISSSTTGHFSIESSTTGDFSIWDKSTTGDFSIWDKSTTGYFSIWDKSTTGYFRISSSTTGYFSIWDKSTTGYFSISSSTSPFWDIADVFASFTFNKATIGQCKLTNCTIPRLRIENECAMELYVSGGAINLVDFSQLTLGKSSVVSIANASLYSCIMNEFAMLGSLYLRNIDKADTVIDFLTIAGYEPPESDKVALDNYKNKRYHYDSHINELEQKLTNPTPTFRIVQSSLGKTEFTECDLGKFTFEYNNSKLTDVFISGGSVPKENIIILDEDYKSLGWYQQKVSVYNQFKKIFAAQGDVYYESVFHAQTAFHQLHLLKHLRKEKQGRWYARWFSEESFDILAYRLNQYTNKHSASWGRALGFIFVSSIILYTVYLIASGLFGFNPKTSHWDWGLVGYYFSFLDPTHKLDFMKDAGLSVNFGTMALDFTGRIIVGYGIYQLISAFRKHGKKV